MIQLNDDFLRSVDLGDLPVADKQKMLQHIYETLELRVGMHLAKQMSETQLDEFEKFVDGNRDFAKHYLDGRLPGWEQDQMYLNQRQKTVSQGKNPDTAIAEFAALKWLEVNFPNHKSAIEDELEKLRLEIKSQAPAILQATLEADSAPPAPIN